MEDINEYNKQLKEGWDKHNYEGNYLTRPNPYKEFEYDSDPSSDEDWDPRDDHLRLDLERYVRDQVPENDVPRPDDRIVEEDLEDMEYTKKLDSKRFGFPIQSKIRIFEWDSRERNVEQFPNHYEYRIDFDFPYENVVAVELLQAAISKTEYNINENNRYIDWQEFNDAGEYSNIFTVPVAIGDYPSNNELTLGVKQALNRVQDIIVKPVDGATLPGNSIFDVYIEDVDYYIRRQSRCVIEMSRPGTNTTYFKLLWETGPSRTRNIAETLGFKRKDFESNRSVQIGAGLIVNQVAPNSIVRSSGQFFTDQDVNRRVRYDNSLISTSRIGSFLDQDQVFTTTTISNPQNNLAAGVYTRADATSPCRMWTTRPPYVDVHTRELDSIQNGLLARIPLVAQETLYEKPYKLRRFFHPIKTLRGLTLSFSRFAYQEEKRPEDDQNSDRIVKGRRSTVPYEFNGVPHALTFEIITIERFHPNNYIIESR